MKRPETFILKLLTIIDDALKKEIGDRKKHHFGTLYRGEDGEVYIKLNLQIRFKQ